MKNIVSSTKVKLLAAACVITVLLVTVLPGSAFAASNTAGQYIGEAKAKSIALNHAGVTEQQATFLKVHLDYDDRRVVYDVEFYSGNTEYDYEIGATDGRILEYDKDIEYYSIPGNASTSTNAGQYIGDAKAKSIALSHAGITEGQATFIKAYLDYDDGRVVYDIEFYSGDTEYDYEIDAVSGEIYEFDREIEYYSIPNNSSGSSSGSASVSYNTGNYIGDAKAKSIALNHAGIAENQTTFINVHLDYDDGRVDYDVEFYASNTEYEYEIDAVSGQILEFDRETKHNTSTVNNQASQPAQQTNVNTGNYIGDAKAKSIALSSAGLSESQVRKMKVKLDREHGTMVYDVEFKSGQMEYEYEINATSGAIVESDIEYDD